MRSFVSLLAISALLAACASPPSGRPDRSGLDPLFTLPFVAADAVGVVVPPASGEPRAYMVETRFVRGDGVTVTAPSITVLPRQRANVQVVNQTSYVKTFDVEWSDGTLIVDPVVDIIPTGLTVDVCADRDGDRIALAYRVRVSELVKPIPACRVKAGARPVTIQLPKAESSDVAGVRSVVPGTFVRVGGLATREGAVDVLLRVDEVGLDPAWSGPDAAPAGQTRGLTDGGPADFASPGADDVDLAAWLDATSDELLITVEPVVVASGTPTGQVLDAEAARAFDAGAPSALRRLAFSTRVVEGAAARVLLAEAFVTDYESLMGSSGSFDYAVEPRVQTVTSGVVASIDADGRLALSWATTSEVATFTTTLANGPDVVTIWLPELHVSGTTIGLVPGEWLATFGHMADGRVLAARVRITPVQRRVASQMQATR